MVLVNPGYRASRPRSTSRSVSPSPSSTASPPTRPRIMVGTFTLTPTCLCLPARRGGHAWFVRRWQAAEQLVVDQLGNGGVLAAHRALGVPPQLDGGELHVQRVEQEQ